MFLGSLFLCLAYLVSLSMCTVTWNGSFIPYVGNTKFCTDCAQYGPQNKCGFICAGGGSGGPNTCSSDVCSSGQYTFTADKGWQIKTTKAQSKGHIPYRAFAYLPFCYGASMGSCWNSGNHEFSFNLMTSGMAGWGVYVKLLFWTDSGNILGLLPPGAPGAKQHQPPVTSYSLIGFPDSDYPNNFKGQMAIKDDTLYHIDLQFAGTSVTINVNGTKLATGTISAVGTTDNGPQIGMYGFDYGGTSTSDVSSIFLNNLVVDGKQISAWNTKI